MQVSDLLLESTGQADIRQEIYLPRQFIHTLLLGITEKAKDF